MRILMLNPPYFNKFSRSQRSPAVTKSGCIYYPLWIAYATALLDKNGHDIKLIDAPGDNLSVDDVMKSIKEFRPELTIIDTSTPSIYNDIKIAEQIKEQQDTYLTLVGTHVSVLTGESFEISKSIDAIARREYDKTLVEVANALAGKKTLKGVNGLSFRDDGKILHNAERTPIENLDEIPFVSEVYKKHLNIGNYFYGANLYPVVTILTGRGCPHHCVYCVYPQTMMGHKYRYRSIKNVVDELEYIKETFPQAKEVFRENDTLTVNRERCQELSDEILSRNLKITWSTNSRVDVDLKTLKAIKRAGCRLLCVGFESGDQRILNNIRKGLKVAQTKEFMKDSRKAGILIHGCFLVGNKGETKETLRTTLNLAKELKPDTAQFYPIMVYPGTEAYNWAKENNYLTTNNFREWLTDDGLHNCVVSRPELTSEELVEFCDKARREYYFNPGYIISKLFQSLFNPSEAKRIFKAAKISMKYLIHGSFHRYHQNKEVNTSCSIQ